MTTFNVYDYGFYYDQSVGRTRSGQTPSIPDLPFMTKVIPPPQVAPPSPPPAPATFNFGNPPPAPEPEPISFSPPPPPITAPEPEPQKQVQFGFPFGCHPFDLNLLPKSQPLPKEKASTQFNFGGIPLNSQEPPKEKAPEPFSWSGNSEPPKEKPRTRVVRIGNMITQQLVDPNEPVNSGWGNSPKPNTPTYTYDPAWGTTTTNDTNFRWPTGSSQSTPQREQSQSTGFGNIPLT